MNRVLNAARNTYRERPIVLVLVAYVIVSLAIVPQFASPKNLLDILVQSSDLIVLSIGMGFVILNGGIDFSVTAVTALASVVGASIMNLDTGLLAGSPYGFLAAIGVMLLIGLGIAAINGLSVVVLKMPSFIATMATSLVFGGAAVFYTRSATITNLPRPFTFMGDGSILGIPFPIIVAAVVVLVAHYVLSATVFGRTVYAVGSNPKASFISGLPVRKTIFILFLLSGFLAALGGTLMSARLGAGTPSLGQERLMDIVAAVIIGGTSIFGGAGTVLGTVAGALFITILNNSLNLVGIPWYMVIIVKGAVIFFIALFDAVRRLRR
jgi:ribose transport system permease protein